MLLVSSALLTVWMVCAADWLSVRGDPENSAYQRDEKTVGIENVGKIRLLWQQPLVSAPQRLSDPLILGPIVTDHGVKELVFVNDGTNVYSVDADLGKVFWTRKLNVGSAPKQADCQAVGNRSLVFHWSADDLQPASSRDDEYSDGDRSLYALSSSGQVFVLRPRTGGDIVPPIPIAASPNHPRNIFEDGESLRATSAVSCDAEVNQIWSRAVSNSGESLAASFTSTALPSGKNGALATFEWKRRTVAVALGAGEEPLLPVVETRISTNAFDRNDGGVATWRDKLGVQWVCIAAGHHVRKYRVRDEDGKPDAALVWSADHLQAQAPTVANGLIYFLSQSAESGGHLVLHALDSKDGKELYSSGDAITARTSSGHLAFANGHVCFSTEEGAVYCFGLPFDM